MRTRAYWTVAALAALLAACTAHKADEPAAKKKGPPTRLLIHATGTEYKDHTTIIQGTVENPFDETVHGVRYVVTVFRHGGSLQVLDLWQREDLDTTIGAGKSVPMTLNVVSAHLRSRSARFRIEAQPVKLGSKSMPPPKGWKE